MALAALGAGIEVHEVLPREVVDEPVADLLGLGVRRERRELLAGGLVSKGDRGRPGQHVHGLRERDRGDEGERGDPMHPPLREMRALGRVSGQPEAPEALAGGPAEWRPDLEARTELGDPEGFEEEAGQGEEEEDSEEKPVADHVRQAVVLPLRAVGSPVVEAERPEDTALHRHDREPDD